MGNELSKACLKKYKAKGKNKRYIKVWKVVDDTGKKYRPEGLQDNHLYQAGLNRAARNAYEQDELIHAFRNERSAKGWVGSHQVIVEAMVHPAWVKAIGNSGPELTLTTKAIVMPAYPKRKVTVKEFRAAIKGKKIKVYSWE